MKTKLMMVGVLLSVCYMSCEEDATGADDSNGSASVSGTYTLSSVTVHSGGDCSVDDGTSGLCFPDIAVSQSDCVETGVGTCMDENGDGIEGIDAEADCTGDNQWVNFGWNLWAAFFPDMYFTFSDDGTYTDWEDENGTWTLDGSTLTMTDSEDEVTTATYSGNTITSEIIDEITSAENCVEMVFTK